MSSPLGSSQRGKSAFNWSVYKNRKSALQYLQRNGTLVDIILESEDGSCREYVHSQVISAFGDKINKLINGNSTQAHNPSSASASSPAPSASSLSLSLSSGKPLRVIRVPKLNKYTLNILVECAYTGYIRTDLPSGGIWQVLEMADHYEMTEVIRACCAFLTKNLNRWNCVHFYHIGIKYRHLLQDYALHKIRSNFKYILGQNLLRDADGPVRGFQANAATDPTLRQLLMSATFEQLQQVAQVPPAITAQVQSVNNQPERQQQQQQQRRRRQQQQQQQVATSIRGPDEEPMEEDASVPTATEAAVTTGRRLSDEEREQAEQRNNNLATIRYEHFEPLLMHDKLNVENEESIWHAIRHWCNYKPGERIKKLASLLKATRLPRLRTGLTFCERYVWQDSLIKRNYEAQSQLAVMERNQRDLMSGASFTGQLDGFGLPCAAQPRQLRPRVPHSILLAIGGWQQGQPTTLIEAYDVNTNMWFESRKRIMSRLAYHGLECINGLLYICGGTDGSEIVNELFTFDPVRGTCHQRPSMREPRCYVSTAVLDNHLYALGGHNGVRRMRSVERYDLSGEMWHRVADMNVARSDASACTFKSLIYIAGGLNDVVIESSVEFYNYSDDSWTFVASMISPRTSFTLLLYRDSLLAIGGNNGTERLASVEQYNFSTKVWQPHSQMRHKRSTFDAALVDENKLLVVGGYNGQTPFNQVEMYDEKTSSWLLLPKIRFDRSGLKVVVVEGLANGCEYSFLGSVGAGGGSSSPSTLPSLSGGGGSGGTGRGAAGTYY